MASSRCSTAKGWSNGPPPSSSGQRYLARTSQEPSSHSSEYRGSDEATHSPHPSTSPPSVDRTARTRIARFPRSSPKLVRNRRTRGRETSLSSMLRTRDLVPPLTSLPMRSFQCLRRGLEHIPAISGDPRGHQPALKAWLESTGRRLPPGDTQPRISPAHLVIVEGNADNGSVLGSSASLSGKWSIRVTLCVQQERTRRSLRPLPPESPVRPIADLVFGFAGNGVFA